MMSALRARPTLVTTLPAKSAAKELICMKQSMTACNDQRQLAVQTCLGRLCEVPCGVALWWVPECSAPSFPHLATSQSAIRLECHMHINLHHHLAGLRPCCPSSELPLVMKHWACCDDHATWLIGCGVVWFHQAASGQLAHQQLCADHSCAYPGCA